MKFNKSKGFTIIEVLVAMIILSIGVLGLGVLQLTSLQNSQSGQMKSQASIMAYDIIDSMRTNIPSVTSGSYGIALAADTPEAVNCYGGEADCTAAQMATSDVNHWRTTLGDSLPSGNGAIATTDLGDTTLVSVTISWVDPYSAADGNEQIVLTSELPQ
jgi:type IV pilus assembly protein PilV